MKQVRSPGRSDRLLGAREWSPLSLGVGCRASTAQAGAPLAFPSLGGSVDPLRNVSGTWSGPGGPHNVPEALVTWTPTFSRSKDSSPLLAVQLCRVGSVLLQPAAPAVPCPGIRVTTLAL